MIHPRGFTLIELLVVIAIISILSVTVLASLSAARTKAEDSAAKKGLADMRTAAALLYANTGSNDTACDPDTNAGQLFRSAFATADKAGSAYCVESVTSVLYRNDGLGNIIAVPQIGGAPYHDDEWAAYVRLKSGKYQCVDYLGTATTVPTAPALSIFDHTCL